MNTIIKISALTFAIVLSLIIILILVLWLYSQGKPEKFFDRDGNTLSNSISEKIFVKIGGIKQGMFIRSKNIQNPVLLYIHGGPAFPNYFLFDKYEPGLEEYFTVCYWEQRGGGLSYSKDIPLETMNYEQLTSDAIEVSNYLINRFGKEKIYLMAHSGGTPIAIKAVSKFPELYHAYIGMAQITNQSESEKLAYKYMIEQYKANGNTKVLADLKKYPVMKNDSCLVPFFKSLVRDKSMHELGIGTMRKIKSVMTGVFIPVWTCKAYTLKEKFNIWRSKFIFVKKAKFINELFEMDIPVEYPIISIPVYFFSGQYDLTVNVNLSKDYLNKLQAPIKGFYTFENSAHSPLFEEPLRVREIIEQDVLGKRTDLADNLY